MNATRNIIKHFAIVIGTIMGVLALVVFLPIITVGLSLYSMSLDNPLSFWDTPEEIDEGDGWALWVFLIVMGALVAIAEIKLYTL